MKGKKGQQKRDKGVKNERKKERLWKKKHSRAYALVSAFSAFSAFLAPRGLRTDFGR